MFLTKVDLDNPPPSPHVPPALFSIGKKNVSSNSWNWWRPKRNMLQLSKKIIWNRAEPIKVVRKKLQLLEKGQYILDDLFVKLITYFQRGIKVGAHILEPLQNAVLAKKFLVCGIGNALLRLSISDFFPGTMFLIKGRYIYYFLELSPQQLDYLYWINQGYIWKLIVQKLLSECTYSNL